MHLHRKALKTMTAATAVAMATWVACLPTAFAEAPDHRIEVGIVGRFMPTGWFEWSGRNPASLDTYPALGGAPFVDWCLDRVFSIGFMPEVTLNVIPKLETDYPVSAMVTGSVRLKAQYPDSHVAGPYVLLAPGYSALFRYGGVHAGDARGFSLGAYAGFRIPVSRRNALLAEGGYLRGFQSDGGSAYAPSYVVVALGWQMAP